MRFVLVCTAPGKPCLIHDSRNQWLDAEPGRDDREALLGGLSLSFQELLQLEYSTRHIPEVLLSSLESVVQHVNSKPYFARSPSPAKFYGGLTLWDCDRVHQMVWCRKINGKTCHDVVPVQQD